MRAQLARLERGKGRGEHWGVEEVRYDGRGTVGAGGAAEVDDDAGGAGDSFGLRGEGAGVQGLAAEYEDIVVGIGRALVGELLARGVPVMAAALDGADLASLRAEGGGRLATYAVDLTREGAVDSGHPDQCGPPATTATRHPCRTGAYEL